MSNFLPRAPASLLLAGIFLLVLGVRWLLVEGYTSQVPYWDEWLDDAPLLRAYHTGELSAAQIIAPFNQHRPAWQRLAKVAVFSLNERQWDSQLQATVNAILGALLAVLLAVVFGRKSSRAPDWPVLALLAGLFLTPVFWTNITWAFQIALYTQLLLGISAWVLLFGNTPRRVGWWLGALCLLAGLVTQGSGFFAAAAVVGALSLGALTERRIGREIWPTLGLTLLVAALGLWLHGTAPALADQGRFAAGSVREFALALFKNLSWPLALEAPDNSVYYVGMLLWLPAPVLLGLWILRPGLRARLGLTAPEFQLLAATLLWVLAQIAAIAIFRGAEGRGPSWRHYEIHALGLLINAWALSRLCSAWATGAGGARANWQPLLAGAVFGGLAAAGILMQSNLALVILGYQKQANALRANAVRGYLTTGEGAPLHDPLGFSSPFLFHPDPEAVLDDPVIREILPAEIRPPLALEKLTSGDSFTGSRIPPMAGGKVLHAPAISSWPARPASGSGDNNAVWDLPPSRFHKIQLNYLAPPGSAGKARMSTQRGSAVLGANIEYDWETLILPIHPPESAGGSWLELRQPPEVPWLVFTYPAELGRFSALATQARSISGWVVAFGGLLVAASAALHYLRR